MTIKKAGYRTTPSFSRDSDNLENSAYLPNWMREFASNLSKVSVQPRRHEDSVFDQISSIINSSKPKYSSVEDAVKDMQERSGLIAYQGNIKALADMVKKNAAKEDEEHDHKDGHGQAHVLIFDMKPQIKDTVDNYITDTHGNLEIPAIIEKIKSIHRNDVQDDSAWDDDGLMQYINDKCIAVKKNSANSNDDQYTTLGRVPHYEDKDIDQSNNDALFSLTPAVVK